MNMHGVIAPPEAPADPTPVSTRLRRIADALIPRRWLLLFVVLPTLVVAGYYYLVASDQYQSEAHILVRSAQATPQMPGGLGAVVGMAAGLTDVQGEANSVADYLISLDAVTALQRGIGLIGRYQRPEVDRLSQLAQDETNPQDLLDYYRDHVSVELHSDTGITSIAVRAFTPTDAQLITTQLLRLGEQRVNSLNERGYGDAIREADSRLTEAETKLALAQRELGAFRESRRDIDPSGTGEAQIGLVSSLTEQLARAKAQLASMKELVRHDSPQVIAQSAHVRSLQSQVNAQAGRLTTGSGSIAAGLGTYEDLRLRQELAAKQYEVAAANAQSAKERASKQQLYIVRVVEPNRPVKSQYPRRLRIVATVFLGLLVAYAIGWLLLAGVREHSL